MRFDARRRVLLWTAVTLLILAVIGWAKRVKPPAMGETNEATRHCDGCRPESGALILASAQELERMDPETGARVILKDVGGAVYVYDPSYVARDSLLVNVCGVVAGCALQILDLTTGESAVIARDIAEVAVDTVTRSVYFYADRDERGVAVFVAPLTDLTQRTRVAYVEQDNNVPPLRPIDLQRAPVVLPNGRGVVFLGSGDSLTLYDAATWRATALPITDCTPFLVRTVTGEVLCVDHRNGSWYLLALDTRRRTIIPEMTMAGGAVYDAHNDAVFFSLSAFALPERDDMYRLPLGVRARRERVAKGVYFSSGIWVPTTR